MEDWLSWQSIDMTEEGGASRSCIVVNVPSCGQGVLAGGI